MKIQNKKTFNCVANTKKGNFCVIISVWEEVFEAGEKFSGSFFSCTWKSEAYIIIDDEKLEVSFNQYDGTKVKSYAVAEKYGINGQVSLMCDCSAVKNYINGIEMLRIISDAESDKEIATSKMIHNL